MESRIKDAVALALTALGAPALPFAVERPADHSHGDYAVNAALVAAKVLGKSPREIADALASELTKALGEEVKLISVAGPGFINITVARDAITDAIESAATKKEEWGKNLTNAGTSVMIEYSNPNPFKEMHIGHLVGSVLGESISRLLEASSARVLRDTFGGDVGPHVAKALWALQKKGVTNIANAQEIGAAYIQGSNAYEESEEAKQEINDLNTKIYDIVARQADVNSFPPEDRELLELWRRGREISMEEFHRIFKVLGSKFDYVFYDSDTTEPGMRIVQENLKNGIFEESDGAIIYRGEKKGLHTLVFVTSRGTPTYETKDVGLAYLKEERCSTDRVIILTAVEQQGHFKVYLAALEEVAPLLAKKTEHVSHGLLQLTTGKMSSRKGNIITGAELIESMITLAGEKNEDPLIAEQVAIAAIKYMILRQSAGSNIIFNPEQSLSLEGDSGPYLQYALVRAKSILASAEKEGERGDAPAEPYLIERLITRFPEVVARAQEERAPHHVVQYLTMLAGEWNSFYATNRIIGGAHESYKLLLARAFANTMEQGLWVLGIPAPEKM